MAIHSHPSLPRSRRTRRSGKPTPPPSPFTDILCAVDGSRGSAEAVQQAVALCGPATALGFVAIAHTEGTGFSARADLGEEHARRALEEAAWEARRAGVVATTELRHGARVGDRLLAACEGHEMLAIGCHGGTRLGGMMAGSTATQIAHRAELPVLVARHVVGDDGAFPREIMLASDGSPGSWAALRTATALARDRGVPLRVAYVPDGHPERYRELFKQVTEVERQLGAAPAFADVPGDPATRIVDSARAWQPSMIVIGKRGLQGLKALGSVSERVVHRAPCSVLVVPPTPALIA